MREGEVRRRRGVSKGFFPLLLLFAHFASRVLLASGFRKGHFSPLSHILPPPTNRPPLFPPKTKKSQVFLAKRGPLVACFPAADATHARASVEGDCDEMDDLDALALKSPSFVACDSGLMGVYLFIYFTYFVLIFIFFYFSLPTHPFVRQIWLN